MVAKAERFALNHEGEPYVNGADPRALVLTQEARLLDGIRRGVEPPAEGRHVRERRLESLAGAAERGRLSCAISALIRRCDS